MKFVQFAYKKDLKVIRVGILNNDQIVDINIEDPTLPTTLIDILKDDLIAKVKRIKPSSTVSIEDVILKAPIHGNDKVLCIGLNFKDHCKEQNLTPTVIPFIFNKFPSTVVGPNDAIRFNDISKKVVCEVEFTVVIGKVAKNVKSEDAYDYVFGYTIAQDIGAVDWEKNENLGQLLLGKAMDTFCPIGPCIVTHDEIGDPQNLNIKCFVNGVQKQSSNTNQFIHKIPDVIARLSKVITLLPGDIILTGTPGGVGVYRNPPEYLQPGDVIRSEVENIGAFEIKVEKY